MSNKVNELINSINELPSIKRLNELENYINNNEGIKDKIDQLLNIQQQMINCKHFNLINAYADYKKQYEDLREEILLLPFMEEYLELLDESHLMLKNICYIIEKEIEDDIINKSN